MTKEAETPDFEQMARVVFLGIHHRTGGKVWTAAGNIWLQGEVDLLAEHFRQAWHAGKAGVKATAKLSKTVAKIEKTLRNIHDVPKVRPADGEKGKR